MRTYNFRSACEHIMHMNESSISYEDEDTPYENRLYRVLGSICISGSEKDVGNIIWELVNPYDTAQTQPQGSNAQAQSINEMVTRHDEQEDIEQLSRYTSSLYELGQEQRIRPQKEIRQLAVDPPLFQVRIHFGNDHGSGTGHRKKYAGHLAAKDLCEQLGIYL